MSLALLVLSTLGGCTNKACRTITRQIDRDWCFAEYAVEAAREGDMSGAGEQLGRIQEPFVQAATIYRMIGIRAPGLNRSVARELCASLADAAQAQCLSTWDRPEVWGQDS